MRIFYIKEKNPVEFGNGIWQWYGKKIVNQINQRWIYRIKYCSLNVKPQTISIRVVTRHTKLNVGSNYGKQRNRTINVLIV